MRSILPPTEPFTITVLPGITFTVAPVSAWEWLTFEAGVERKMSALRDGIETCASAGLLPVQDFDPDNPNHVDALRRYWMIQDIGLAKIIGWTGVKLDNSDEDAPVTAKGVETVLGDWVICKAFWDGVSRWHYERLSAKKKSSSAAAGISAGAPNTAGIAS